MQEVSLKRWKKKKFVNTFPFFHSFPLSFAFSLEKVKWEREREREQQNVSVALEGFSKRTWLASPPFISTLENHRGRQRPILWLRSLRIARSDELVTKNAHEMNPVGEGGEKEKEKKRWRTRNKKNGKRRKKNSGSWLSSSEKEEASAMNCRAFIGGKMARRYFEEEE